MLHNIADLIGVIRCCRFRLLVADEHLLEQTIHTAICFTNGFTNDVRV